MLFQIAANTGAALSLISNAAEVCKSGSRRAKAGAKNAVVAQDIKNYTGDSMLNKTSDRYNEMKQMVREADTMTGFHKAGGAISGFFRGAAEGMKGNVLNTGFSIMTLACKNKTLKTIGIVGTGLSAAWDFIKNGTNLFVKKDIIEN